MKNIKILLVSLLSVTASCSDSSLKKAMLYDENGLVDKAKSELIEVISSSNSDHEIAQAYYLLGDIAYREDQLNSALKSWTHLVETYPNSEHAELVRGKVSKLSEATSDRKKKGQSQKEVVKVLDSHVAQTYLENGDFWTKDKGTFSIDIDWLSTEDRLIHSIKWYDKVIDEFPRSPASLTAYEKKMGSLIVILPASIQIEQGEKLGFLDFGEVDIARTDRWMPVLLQTFENFKRDHPDASTLQSFRYQIVQLYLTAKQFDQARIWLNSIVESSNGDDTFYSDLAQARLKNLKR